jgi:hypothetical protein
MVCPVFLSDIIVDIVISTVMTQVYNEPTFALLAVCPNSHIHHNWDTQLSAQKLVDCVIDFIQYGAWCTQF